VAFVIFSLDKSLELPEGALSISTAYSLDIKALN
jgi:hypothetical protein